MKPPPTVFIVDDDPAVTKAAAQLVEVIGYRPETYHSANDFLEGYELSGPACLVLDLQMPGITGVGLQQALLNTGKALPVVVMTGHGDAPMALKAMKLGAVDFLEKPFRAEEFRQAVEKAVALSEENHRVPDRG